VRVRLIATIVIALAAAAACSNAPASTAVPIVGPTPTPTAVPTPTPIPLDVTKGSMSSPVAKGGKATLTVHTAAGADCKIVVEYGSGPSQASGLVEKTATEAGDVSWTWTVGQTTKAGRYPITVTCFKGERQGTLETTFEVT
jgi:hypothetical protein